MCCGFHHGRKHRRGKRSHDGDHAGVIDVRVAGDFHDGRGDILGSGSVAYTRFPLKRQAKNRIILYMFIFVTRTWDFLQILRGKTGKDERK